MSSTEESKNRMNLAAIKKVDPYAKEIVDTSSHVAFYTFNSEKNEWEKTDVEGAFFVYSRNAQPFHSIFINNRLNTTTCVEPITGHLELQSQPPFLLYRNERSRIRGFWFYNSDECNRISILIANIVQQLANEHQKQQELHHPNAFQKQKIENTDHQQQQLQKRKQENFDLFKMLSNAQQQFKNSKFNNIDNVEFAGNPKQQQQLPQQPPLPQQLPQLQQQQQQQQQNDTTTSNNVLQFFAALEAKPKTAEFPNIKRLLPVDEIEKQQRVKTPMDEGGSSQQKHLNLSSRQPVQAHHQHQTKTASSLSSNREPAATTTTAPLPPETAINNGGGLNALLQVNMKSEPPANELAKFLNSVDLNSGVCAKAQPPPPPQTPSSVPTSEIIYSNANENNLMKLLAGNVAAASLSTASSAATPSIFHMESGQNSKETIAGKPALMPPTMFDKPPTKCPVISTSGSASASQFITSNNNTTSCSTKLEPLNSTQLAQAFSYLLQNDEEFVQKLHEAYLKTFTKTILGSSYQ